MRSKCSSRTSTFVSGGAEGRSFTSAGIVQMSKDDPAETAPSAASGLVEAAVRARQLGHTNQYAQESASTHLRIVTLCGSIFTCPQSEQSTTSLITRPVSISPPLHIRSYSISASPNETEHVRRPNHRP